MDICHILPVENSVGITQYREMYLAQNLIDHPSLCGKIKMKKSYKILDNGCYELGKSIDLNTILKVAEAIGADEIILPDIMYDIAGTVKLVTETIAEIHKIYGATLPFKLMAVVQGVEFGDYVECASLYKYLGDISCIGIPKNFLKESKKFKTVPATDYANMLRSIERAHFAKGISDIKEIHLLGVIWSLLELGEVSKCVRSVDTSLVVEKSKKEESIWTPWKSTYSEFSTMNMDTVRILEKNVHDLEEYINGFYD